MMSDTEAALAEMAFVISSMGDKTAMIIPTISSWFAVSWGIEYSVLQWREMTASRSVDQGQLLAHVGYPSQAHPGESAH